jgi:lysozyme family protein
MKKSEIIKRIIEREGGFSDHPNDTGGATRYGVTEKTARRHGYEGDMADLPYEFAVKVYSNEKWDVVNASKLPVNVREQVVDFCVLAGPFQAGRALQRAINVFGAQIKEDGIVGSKTAAAAKEADPDALPVALRSFIAQYFIALARTRPANRAFIDGWLSNRVELK